MSHLRRIKTEMQGLVGVTYAPGTLVLKHGRDTFKKFIEDDAVLSDKRVKNALGQAALVEFCDGHRMVVSERDLEDATTLTLPAELREVFPDDHPNKNTEVVKLTGGLNTDGDIDENTLFEVTANDKDYALIAWNYCK